MSNRHNNQNVREGRGEEEDGCGDGHNRGQGAGDNNEVKILSKVMGGRGCAITLGQGGRLLANSKRFK